MSPSARVEESSMRHLTSCFGIGLLSKLGPDKYFVYFDEPQFD